MTRLKAIIGSYVGIALVGTTLSHLINSYWAFVPASGGAILLMVRTALEDRFLSEQLPGYAAYAAKTRWKLFPGVF